MTAADKPGVRRWTLHVEEGRICHHPQDYLDTCGLGNGRPVGVVEAAAYDALREENERLRNERDAFATGVDRWQRDAEAKAERLKEATALRDGFERSLQAERDHHAQVQKVQAEAIERLDKRPCPFCAGRREAAIRRADEMKKKRLAATPDTAKPFCADCDPDPCECTAKPAEKGEK